MDTNRMTRVWWIIWTDGTRATCAKSYDEAIRIADRKGIGYKIE